MSQTTEISKLSKIMFPIVVLICSSLFVPDSTPLIGMLTLGNLLKECGVVDRLSKTAQNELINIITIFLGLAVGSTMTAESFLQSRTLFILILGLIAFIFGTASGLIFGKIMCKVTGGKINPLIGAAGVSAVPMAARVVQKIGQEENPSNFLLMHAMGPNVAGVIGSAVAAGILLAIVK
jgi:oxaloacetate decarboxylase beta subunit